VNVDESLGDRNELCINIKPPIHKHVGSIRLAITTESLSNLTVVDRAHLRVIEVVPLTVTCTRLTSFNINEVVTAECASIVNQDRIELIYIVTLLKH